MIQIRKANTNDAHTIALMVAKLLTELEGKSFEQHSFTNAVKECMDTDLYTVFLAFSENEECIGIVSVSLSRAVYAGGTFGIIQELYVQPEMRSLKIGQKLIKTIIDYGVNQQWKRIEVGAPNPLNWQRTIDFYEREGFTAIGPRLKMVL
ncbi:GNAT family N-acetyltransferase [Paenibacillus silviterrae]|uniref:GNAT family N-acetyltransferase n=1 Tax=Paenibacillus silviterrae TaxID=3242194 RepID=UPI002543FA6A|nr:GNAT family N-acetyltransferase [Paenibacillus chinjuensis]